MQDNGLVFISCGKWRAISTLQNLFLINCPVTAENIIAILNNETECSLSNCFTGGLTTVGIFFGMLLMDYYRKKEYVSSFIQSRFASKHSRNIHAISSETVSQFYAVSQLSKEQLQKLCIHMSSFLLEMYSSKQGTDYFALAENEQRRMDLLLTIIKKLGQMKESFDTYERILVEGKEQSQFHMQKSRTDIVVHNFLANLVLSSVLIGATTGNSFGTNLNIPLYYSTKGYKAALWYIVVFSVILAVGFLILIFLSCNKILVKYIKSQRNQSFQVLQRE
ncbi:uncharacterized protein Gasu_65870 [Galdieria sulphuraria]|uniref:Uncharacterized protein n=1 Tax=Galdieria sulphuraria TaxID=130081 RepID=M2XQN8_GALSU|nr:uncharacterized protein Gasu_65870 [Galdieria sulphuraria]EME25754.1 hypothetical protein Gasu_65870 [Galdieria sulphuraria]|eukprot:XP_005702274.1 hypothetical protein Gasu_65870 [Galdieria sulphuraria]